MKYLKKEKKKEKKIFTEKPHLKGPGEHTMILESGAYPSGSWYSLDLMI